MAKIRKVRKPRKPPPTVLLGKRKYSLLTGLPGCPPAQVLGMFAKGDQFSRGFDRTLEPLHDQIEIFLDLIRGFYPSTRYAVLGVEEDVKTGNIYLVSSHWLPGSAPAVGRASGYIRGVFRDAAQLAFNRRAHWVITGFFDPTWTTIENLVKTGFQLPLFNPTTGKKLSLSKLKNKAAKKKSP